jgi:hypothetical protein
MKLISFDIGIKNMAYCIFHLEEGSQSIIYDWNVINLMEKDETEKNYCSCYLKAKNKTTPQKVCGKVAKFSKNSFYFCEKHAKNNGEYIIPSKENSPPFFNKMKIDELKTVYKKLNIFNDSENLRKPDLLEKIHKFYQEKCFIPIKNKKTKSANDTDLIMIGKNMKTLLNQVEGIQEITHVIIENQISPIANRMKTIQGMLAQYFIMNNSDIHIEFISSANKLRYFEPIDKVDKNKKLENVFIENSEGATARETREPKEKSQNTQNTQNTQNSVYKKHKIDGVLKCSQLLEKNPEFKKWKHVLETKKKDDLADCFLQGIWYINKNGINI